MLGINYVTSLQIQVKADEDRGITYLVLAIISFIIIHKFFKQKDEENVYICNKCEEVYAEKNINKEKVCGLCNGKLINVVEYYNKSNKSEEENKATTRR